MKIKLFILVLLCLLVFSACKANAQENPKWFTDYEVKIHTLVKQKDCDGIFNFLWPEAKSGNLAARFWLLTFVVPMIHGDGLAMPGHDRTGVTMMRDGTILAVHTLGLDFGKMPDSENMWYEFLFSPQIMLGSQSSEECIKNEKSGNCTKLAIEQKLVPTFEQYANEIDGLITNGAKPVCSFYPDNDTVDSSPKSAVE